jgi:hypothetical protein
MIPGLIELPLKNLFAVVYSEIFISLKRSIITGSEK